MSETELFLCFGQTLGIKYQTQVSITLSWILSSEWTLSTGLFSFRFFLCNLSQVLIFCNMQMSRDFSRDICYTSP